MRHQNNKKPGTTANHLLQSTTLCNPTRVPLDCNVEGFISVYYLRFRGYPVQNQFHEVERNGYFNCKNGEQLAFLNRQKPIKTDFYLLLVNFISYQQRLDQNKYNKATYTPQNTVRLLTSLTILKWQHFVLLF